MDLFPNETVLFQWLLFMTALFALNYGVFRPVMHLIRERKERTEGERAKAEELVKKAESLLAECERRIGEARKAGMEERESRLREAEQAARERIRQVRQEIDKEMGELRESLEQERRKASLQLKQYGETIAREIAEKILERPV